jgi:hypothetical protein
MFRRELFDLIDGYREECEFWEDLDFVIRASLKTRILVTSRPLYQYRQSTASTRITSNQDRVENALDLRYRAMALARKGLSYEDILQERGHENSKRLDPRVFISLGLLSLWSDQRPNLGGRLLRRARLGFNAATMVAIVWLSWAKISPVTLRILMNLLSRLRNAGVDPKPPADDPVEWRPGRGLADLSRDPAGGDSPTNELIAPDKATPKIPELQQEAAEIAKG